MKLYYVCVPYNLTKIHIICPFCLRIIYTLPRTIISDLPYLDFVKVKIIGLSIFNYHPDCFILEDDTILCLYLKIKNIIKNCKFNNKKVVVY